MSEARRALDVLRGSELLEELASVEHERWSHWQRYLHSRCIRGEDGSLTIPPDLVDQWTTQIETEYPNLSEMEKESDRRQVRRYLPIIMAALEGTDPMSGRPRAAT